MSFRLRYRHNAQPLEKLRSPAACSILNSVPIFVVVVMLNMLWSYKFVRKFAVFYLKIIMKFPDTSMNCSQIMAGQALIIFEIDNLTVLCHSLITLQISQSNSEPLEKETNQNVCSMIWYFSDNVRHFGWLSLFFVFPWMHKPSTHVNTKIITLIDRLIFSYPLFGYWFISDTTY